MGQRVHPGGSGQSLRHGGHHVRIDHGDVRDIVGVHADELPFFLDVRDHVVDGGFRSGAAGGRNGNREDRALLCRRDAFEGTDIGEFRIVDHDADPLAGIHGGAAADGDHEIGPARPVGFHAVLDVFDGGIRFDVRIDGIGNAVPVQQVRHLRCDAEFDQVGVRCDKRFLKAVGGDDSGNLVDRSVAVIGNTVQDKTID